MDVWVVMRARNDMPIVRETLRRLAEQDLPHRLLVLDNASHDGTREEAFRHAHRLEHVPAGTYVPGRVLNQAMEMTDGEIVVFLNSDCILQTRDSLRRLVEGLGDRDAAFGRQIPRPDCHPLHARDTEATFGDGHQHATWRHCFSMAFSAIRRAAWEARPFDETLRYSEDVEWTWQLRQRGGRIAYVPAAIAEHSHNYDLRASYRRHFGEGEADARIFSYSRWQRCLLRFTLLPWLRQLIADVRWCLANGAWGALLHAPLLRTAQALGRRAGFEKGRRA